MRITELVNENRDLNEGPIAQAIGKGVGGLAKGIGAVAGGIAGIPGAFKKGFTAGKSTVSGDSAQEPTPNQTQSTQQTTSASTTPAAQPASVAAPAPQSGASAFRDIISKLKTLDPESKEKIANVIQKDLTGTGLAKPSQAPTAKKVEPTVPPVQTPATSTTQTPASQPVGTTAQTTATAPSTAGQKLSAKDQNALKARLKAGQGLGAKTKSGFGGYVQGGGGQTLAGADAQGNPVFKQNVQRESVEFYSNFLQMKI